jgi:hypothetical protein
MAFVRRVRPIRLSSSGQLERVIDDCVGPAASYPTEDWDLYWAYKYSAAVSWNISSWLLEIRRTYPVDGSADDMCFLGNFWSAHCVHVINTGRRGNCYASSVPEDVRIGVVVTLNAGECGSRGSLDETEYQQYCEQHSLVNIRIPCVDPPGLQKGTQEFEDSVRVLVRLAGQMLVELDAVPAPRNMLFHYAGINRAPRALVFLVCRKFFQWQKLCDCCVLRNRRNIGIDDLSFWRLC